MTSSSANNTMDSMITFVVLLFLAIEIEFIQRS